MNAATKPSGFREFEFDVKNTTRFRESKPSPPSRARGDVPGPKSRTNIVSNNGNGHNFDGAPRDFNAIERTNEGTTGTDFGVRGVFNIAKSLDANRYATKKTIAQGMLDIALLTANASQLKYILQVGKQHEFYTLMLTLISVSIGLQLLQGIICIMLGSTFNINKMQDQPKANVWNNVSLAMMLLTVAVNVIISAFEMRSTNITSQQSEKLFERSVIR